MSKLLIEKSKSVRTSIKLIHEQKAAKIIVFKVFTLTLEVRMEYLCSGGFSPDKLRLFN